MGFWDFLTKLLSTNKKDIVDNDNQLNNHNNVNEKVNNKMKTTKKDNGFHPEILFLINKDDAEYVEFTEIK